MLTAKSRRLEDLSNTVRDWSGIDSSKQYQPLRMGDAIAGLPMRSVLVDIIDPSPKYRRHCFSRRLRSPHSDLPPGRIQHLLNLSFITVFVLNLPNVPLQQSWAPCCPFRYWRCPALAPCYP